MWDHQICLVLAMGRSPLIQSLKQPRGLGGFRCLCYLLELVSPAGHPCCRLKPASLAAWRRRCIQLVIEFMPGTLPCSDGQYRCCCCRCVRLFIRETNQPRSTITTYTTCRLKSAKGSSCEQHQSHLKEIKFLLKIAGTILHLFSAVVPVACA
jgi:hypothetical protein